MNKYQSVTLCAEIMYINRIPMLITISRHIRFGTIESIPYKANITLIQCLQNVIRLYTRGGFKVTYALVDGEFEALRGSLADNGVILNTAARDRYVGDIERYIRTVKQRVRAKYNMLPFQRIPTRLVIEMTNVECSGFMHFHMLMEYQPP
jgi:hypothetical protein